MSKGGRYVHRPGHPKANDLGMVNVLDLQGEEQPREEARAGTTFMIDRYMENARSPIDGSDIGSRSKHREHMKRHDVVPASDFTETWRKAEAARSNPDRLPSAAPTIARVWEKLERKGR